MIDKVEIAQQLQNLLEERLFGSKPWPIDNNDAVRQQLLAWGLIKMQGDTIHITELGRELSVDVWSRFVGHHEPGEIPHYLSDNGLITKEEANHVCFDRWMDCGERLEDILPPILRRLYREKGSIEGLAGGSIKRRQRMYEDPDNPDLQAGKEGISSEDAAAIERGRPTVYDVKLAIANVEAHNWIDPTWVPFYWTCTLFDPEGRKAGSGRAYCASQAMALAWLHLQAPDALINCSIEGYDVELDVPNGWRFECTPPKLTLAVAIAWLNENYAEFADVDLAAGRPAWLEEAIEDLLAEAGEPGADVKWTQ